MPGGNATDFATEEMAASGARSALIHLESPTDANIPHGSIRGVVFKIDICFEDVAFDFSLVASLSKSGISLAGSAEDSRSQNWTVLPIGERCWQHMVQVGGEMDLWGIKDPKPSDFDTGFGIAFQIHTGVLLAKRGTAQEDRNETAPPTTTNGTTTLATSPTTTLTSTSTLPSTAPTTTAEATTTPQPVAPGSFSFRNPTIIISYVASCGLSQQLKAFPGFRCTDDGDSEISRPIHTPAGILVIPAETHLIVRLNQQFLSSGSPAPALDVPRMDIDKTATVKFIFTEAAEKLPRWVAFHTRESRIEGHFAQISAEYESLKELCQAIRISNRTYRGDYVVDMTYYNECLQEIERHPVRAAFIFIGVFGALFTAFGMVIVWRKRQWERNRRSVLASRIDVDGNDTDDLEMGDIRRRDEGYEAAAKLIESRDGRFSITEDDSDGEL